MKETESKLCPESLMNNSCGRQTPRGPDAFLRLFK